MGTHRPITHCTLSFIFSCFFCTSTMLEKTLKHEKTDTMVVCKCILCKKPYCATKKIMWVVRGGPIAIICAAVINLVLLILSSFKLFFICQMHFVLNFAQISTFLWHDDRRFFLIFSTLNDLHLFKFSADGTFSNRYKDQEHVRHRFWPKPALREKRERSGQFGKYKLS